ncbi:MAG: WbqC family protein [Bacteroidetes bacterium]|nr:WbqC family protein [Bacteroidota bacterium]
MKAAILQSNYIPWKGYFDLMNSADVFIIYDEVQYTKNDWRNRNKIKTSNGLIWLTIPVKQAQLSQRIIDTEVVNNEWRRKHWNAINLAYSKTPFFKSYHSIFEALYLGSIETNLSKINYSFLTAINEILNIKTKILWSQDLVLIEGKTERLVDLCKKVAATEYISGPSAKDYINQNLFKEEQMKITWMDYSNYPEYTQLYPPYENAISILDLIFNEGNNAPQFMKSFNK